MKKLVSIILTLTIVSSAFALNITSANAEEIPTNETFLDVFKSNSTLAWYDEFEGNTVDETKWEIAKGWGRVEETFGEDTYLCSEMGYSIITGEHYHLQMLLLQQGNRLH